MDYIFKDGTTLTTPQEASAEVLNELKAVYGELQPTPNKAAYKFYWNAGKMGSLEGLFTLTDEEYQSLVGTEVYFGEVLGKHSEVYGTIEANDLTELTRNQEIVKFIANNPSGYNPLDYLEE